MRLSQWRSAIKSKVLALRASGRYGRSIKLRKSGRLREALVAAREGLALLGSPGVCREHPPEASVIICLTIEVEALTQLLGEPGLGQPELEGALVLLRRVPADESDKFSERRTEWISYLETRLANLTSLR